MKLKDIIDFLEELAPPSLQESYDNSGLIVGNGSEEINKAIVCLDAIESIVDEAIEKNAQLIIAHHPIVFSGLKKLNGKNYVERTIIKAIKNNIAIYAIHTNLDNVQHGVNQKISDKIGLINTKILDPKNNLLTKLNTFVPKNDAPKVLEALFEAGAGRIGKYSEASFSYEGTGTFNGDETTNAYIGKPGIRESVNEIKIEVLVENHLQNKILQALFKAHPYEEVAYDLISLKNIHQNIGSGMVGELEKEQNTEDFLRNLQSVFNVKSIKHTALVKNKIKTVALCGGSGSFLLNKAKSAKADIFITSDFKYHEFFDADNQLIIADIGHYETEQYTSELLIDNLNKKFRNFAFLLTDINTNPVKYFI